MNDEITLKNKELSDKLVHLVLTLQKEVKELREDTVVNAQHLSILKSNSTKTMNTLNNEMINHINETSEIIEEVIEQSEENSGNNYTNFLKSLLQEDFAKKQHEIIEELRRELGGKTKPVYSNVKQNSIIVNLSFLMSMLSFGLLLFICFKFNIFAQLF
ncbi:hypothetical protein [Campylobacter jejuni]|uniref:Uncharacterized protein n=1 Tax=Campylobacter jejuni TaxID=197 RepID=A0A431EIH7_CAMJU|nr:hypothetical protein [Campylobacter jejuni]ECL6143836.1 hypothetical protein [Campylobacter jejuni]ECO2639562.1 hypothetical protein [Campylobacter jejuni]RTJ48922.1 hypothetical protein C3H68_01300 [Campylobacter jejuni]RTJ80992.1 hypothetical protein C3H57_01360 [Campylobacter jejuni]HEC1903761.1 hypothetical protein [Campylobacter jejuni]